MNFDKLMEYQNMVQSKLRKEQKQDRTIDLLSIINQLTSGPKNIVQKEQIIVEAVSRGFIEDEIEDLLERLVKKNIIFESSSGYFKKR